MAIARGVDQPYAPIVARLLQDCRDDVTRDHEEKDAGDVDTSISPWLLNRFPETHKVVDPEQRRTDIDACIRRHFEERVDAALAQRNTFSLARHGALVDVPIPFTFADIAAIAVGPCSDRYENDGLIHPMPVQFLLKNGRRYHLDFEQVQGDPTAELNLVYKTAPAFPGFDTNNIWHRILGPSRLTYVACRIITGAVDHDVAREVEQDVVAIAKIRSELSSFIDPQARMGDDWPVDFVVAVSEEADAAILCHRFGDFPGGRAGLDHSQRVAPCN